jgi:hypothetical protein
MAEGWGAAPYDSEFELSPDARFLMVGDKLYDRQTRTTRHWEVEGGFPLSYLHGFTPRGHALLVGSYNFVAWHPYDFIYDVSFGLRLWRWLVSDPIRVIDPTTGREVARTRCQADELETISFSHDGSRMAVFTDEGVYVYDVPARFR